MIVPVYSYYPRFIKLSSFAAQEMLARLLEVIQ